MLQTHARSTRPAATVTVSAFPIAMLLLALLLAAPTVSVAGVHISAWEGEASSARRAGVVSTAPASNAVGVDRSAVITIRFGADVDASTASASTVRVRGAETGALSGTFGTAGDAVTFTPSAPYRSGEIVSVTVTSALLDTGGAAFDSYTFSFTAAVADPGTDIVFSLRQTIDGDLRSAAGSALGDLDGDGDLDATATSTDFTGDVVWYASTPTGFVQTLIDGDFPNPSGLALGDLDNDGDLDLAVAGGVFDSEVGWFENDLDGSPAGFTKRAISTLDGAEMTTLGDLDGDGDLDIVVTSGFGANVIWYENTPVGFAENTVGAYFGAGAAVLGDLDSDGDLDIVVGGGPDGVVVFENAPAGFTGAALDAAITDARGLALGDLDGDGDLDVVVARSDFDTGAVAWYANDGSGFTKAFVDSDFAEASDVTLGDLDGDGDLDVVATAFTDVVWYENDGVSFTGSRVESNSFGISSVVTGDLDGDGDLDIATTINGSGEVVWYRAAAAQPSAVVTTATDEEDGSCADGDCSLRDALSVTASGGAITFAPGLDGQTLALAREVTFARDVTIDASGQAITLDGQNATRILVLPAGVSATLRGLTLTRGGVYGADFFTGSFGGCLAVRGQATVDAVAFEACQGFIGGALAIDFGGEVIVTRSTFAGNRAGLLGGAIYSDSGTQLSLASTTVSGNAAGDDASADGDGLGGGVYAVGTLDLQSATLFDNTAHEAGDQLYLVGVATVASTVLGGGTAAVDDCVLGTAFDDTLGSATFGFSLVEDGSCLPDPAGTNLTGSSLLGPLQNNVGPTSTHLPTEGSPVIDAGSCAGATEDQRGEPRPVVLTGSPADDGCDIGAAEVQFIGELPVELTAFAAAQDAERLVLTWTTATETNNAGFHIEQQNAEDWTERGFVAGAGNALEAQSYTFALDGVAPGAHVFRLRQVDHDGAFGYSSEIEVLVTMREAFRISQAWPNPARESAQISIAVREAQRVQVVLFDAIGREVGAAVAADMTPERAWTARLPLAGVASGAYFVRIQGERFAQTRRITVVR